MPKHSDSQLIPSRFLLYKIKGKETSSMPLDRTTSSLLVISLLGVPSVDEVLWVSLDERWLCKFPCFLTPVQAGGVVSNTFYNPSVSVSQGEDYSTKRTRFIHNSPPSNNSLYHILPSFVSYIFIFFSMSIFVHIV